MSNTSDLTFNGQNTHQEHQFRQPDQLDDAFESMMAYQSNSSQTNIPKQKLNIIANMNNRNSLLTHIISTQHRNSSLTYEDNGRHQGISHAMNSQEGQ